MTKIYDRTNNNNLPVGGCLNGLDSNQPILVVTLLARLGPIIHRIQRTDNDCRYVALDHLPSFPPVYGEGRQ